MNATQNIPLIKVIVNTEYLGIGKGKIGGYWYGITSIPSRQFICHVMLDDGSNWFGLPLAALMAIDSNGSFILNENIQDTQGYDCFSYDIQVIRFDFLRDQVLKYQDIIGMYLFSVLSYDPNGKSPFSEFPEQAKTFTFFVSTEGHFYTMPNNYIRWIDKSLINTDVELPKYQRIEKTFRSFK